MLNTRKAQVGMLLDLCQALCETAKKGAVADADPSTSRWRTALEGTAGALSAYMDAA